MLSATLIGRSRNWHGRLAIAPWQLGEPTVSSLYSEYFHFDNGASDDYSIRTRHRLPPAGKRTREAGFAFGDVQFDESEQTLCIFGAQEPKWQLARSPRADCAGVATIDARMLWDLLRDLLSSE
jgi:hypothetical protein